MGWEVGLEDSCCYVTVWELVCLWKVVCDCLCITVFFFFPPPRPVFPAYLYPWVFSLQLFCFSLQPIGEWTRTVLVLSCWWDSTHHRQYHILLYPIVYLTCFSAKGILTGMPEVRTEYQIGIGKNVLGK